MDQSDETKTRQLDAAADSWPLGRAMRMAPLFRQVKDYIVQRIESNQWPCKTKIPSENQIAAMLNISRSTATRALRELTAEGYLVRIQGVGTFVAPCKPHFTLLEIRSISEEIAARGGVHRAEVISLVQEPAGASLAAAMELPVGAAVFHSVIVHHSDGVPIQLADRYINPALAPDFLSVDFTRTTPSEYLFSRGPLTEAEHTIEAVLPDAATRRRLKMKTDEPCLVIHRRTWSNAIVATKATLIHPASRFKPTGRFKPNPTINPVTD